MAIRKADDTHDLGRIAAIGATIPKSGLARIPADASRNLRHYLYGSPKQDPK